MNRMKNIPILIVVFAIMLGMPTKAQQVSSSLDTTSILVGGQTGLHLNVKCDADAKVIWPEIGDTLRAEIEVVRRSGIDTLITEQGLKEYRQELIITSFDSGYYAVPPFRFRIDIDGLDQELETMAHLLEVHTVTVDTTAAFRDIMPVATVPVTFREVFPWVLAGLTFIAAMVFLWIYLKRRKLRKTTGLPIVRRKPDIPAHKAALDALDTLRAQKLWQQGKLKAYYSAITDILRVYLEGQFNIKAVEMTTTDILDQIKFHPLLKTYFYQTEALFSSSDMVKFAKSKPQPEDNDKIWQDAQKFVLDTHTAFVSMNDEMVNNEVPAPDDVNITGKEVADV